MISIKQLAEVSFENVKNLLKEKQWARALTDVVVGALNPWLAHGHLLLVVTSMPIYLRALVQYEYPCRVIIFPI